MFRGNPDLVLCWFLIVERAKGDESFWFPYLNELPGKDESVLAERELDELQDAELVGEIVNTLRKERQMVWWAVRERVKGKEELFTEDAFAWAYHMG